MADPLRAFVAIELNDVIHQALEEIEDRLKGDRTTPAVRWVAPKNIHLTLKFLGDIDSDTLPALERALADACAGIPPFVLTIAGLGAFPNTRRPNNIWIGARGQVEMAAQLAGRIEDACARLGVPRENRPFKPHLTLGRLKRDASPADRQFVGELITKTQIDMLGELHVDHVSVMKSDLRLTGPVYTRLAMIRLSEHTS